MSTGEARFAALADRAGDVRAADDPEFARLAAVVSVLRDGRTQRERPPVDRLPPNPPGAYARTPGTPSPEFRARLRARLLGQAGQSSGGQEAGRV